jgi:hypothetical protein
MTFEEFKNNLENEIWPEVPSHIRKGQVLMNYLYRVWLKEYNRICSPNYYDRTDIDCFYNDKLIPNTLEHLKKVWKENE